MPYRGPRTSDSWNDTIDEIASDLAAITSEWNSKLHPLLAGIPDGTDDVNVDAFLNGLDGKHLYTDQNATSTSDNGELWSIAYSRPLTIKETIDLMKDEIESNYNDLATLVSDAAGVLTHDQKRAIGLEIFEEGYTFAGISILDRSQTNEYNVSQLAKDLYGTSSVLDGDGISHFGVGGSGASVNDALTAILTAHGGTWTSNVSLVHNISDADVDANADIVQTKLYKSGAGALDTVNIGVDPVNTILDDLNVIRTIIKLLKGTIGWAVNITEPYTGGPTTLDGHIKDFGSGTPSDANPHGLSYDDLGGSDLTNIRSVLGIDGADTIPPYADFPEGVTLSFIDSNDSVTEALAKLDDSLDTVNTSLSTLDTDLDTHVALTNNPHSVTAAQLTADLIMTEINTGAGTINWARIDIDGDGLITNINAASIGTVDWARLNITGDSIVGEVNSTAVTKFDWDNINIDGDGLVTDINAGTSAIDWAKLTISGDNIVGEVNSSATTQFDWDNINTTGSSIADLTTRSHTDLSEIGTRTHATIDTSLDTLEAAANAIVSGTPVASDYAKFVNGTEIEGRSYTEVKIDLSLNNVDNTSDATKNAAAATLTNKRLVTSSIADGGANSYLIMPSTLANDIMITLPLLTTDDEFVFNDHTQTLTNKTLTSPILDTGVSGTAVQDDDTFATPSATKLASSESIKAYVATQAIVEQYIQIRDTKTSGTDGGSSTGDTWITRDLTEETFDTHSLATLSSNQIVLESGTYRCRIHAPGYRVNTNRIKLRNITDTVDILFGTSEYSVSGADSTQSRSFIEGRFTVNASKSLEVQHLCNFTRATDGFGKAQSSGAILEVYTVAEFWKVG